MSEVIAISLLVVAAAVRIWAGFQYAVWLDKEPADVQRRIRHSISRGY